MKKTFSWFMVLFTSMVLLVTGCSNANQITFDDTAEISGFTANGLAAVTIATEFPSGPRSIWPDEIAYGDKNALLYEITGAGAGTIDSNNVFRYEEIIKGKAVVNLLPKDGWNLTLKAYQVTSDNYLNRVVAGGHVVFKADETVNLTSGSTPVTFKLDSVGITDADAKGRVKVTVNFFKEDKIEAVKFEVLNGTGSAVNVSTGSGTASVNDKDDMIKPSGADVITSGDENVTSDGIKFATITGSGSDGYSSAILAGELPIGQHTLKVTFYTLHKDQTSPVTFSSVASSVFVPSQVYQEPIYIEGQNVSSKTIDIPKGVMNKAPAAPINLQSSVSFVNGKASTPCGNSVNAQIISADTIGLDTVADTYDLRFDWEDASLNETKFKLVLSESDVNDTDGVEIKYNLVGDNIIATGLGKHASSSELAKITKKAGSLVAGSTTVTLTMPTTLGFKSAKIYAENKMTDDGEPLTAPCQLKKNIGMKTVVYGLTSTDPGKVAKVTYSSSGVTDGSADKFFVMAYEVGTPASEFMNASSYPYVSIEGGKYALTGWVESANYDFANGTGDDNTGGVVLTSSYTLDKNILVFPRWSVETAVNITFPSYNDFRDLAISTSSNPVICNYDTTSGANNTFTIEAYKAAGTNIDAQPYTDNYNFTVIGVDGTEIYKGGDGSSTTITGIDVASNVLTWNPADPKFTGGVYRVIISYDYDPDGNEANKIKRNISGTVYVKINR